MKVNNSFIIVIILQLLSLTSLAWDWFNSNIGNYVEDVTKGFELELDTSVSESIKSVATNIVSDYDKAVRENVEQVTH